jgi:hypothetical protein
MRIKLPMGMFALAVVLAAAALGPVAYADDIIASPTGITSPTQTITFEEILLPMNSSLTNQYAGLGVTFSPNVYYSPQTGFGNVQGNDIGNFTFPTQPAFVNPMTMSFSSALTAAAFSFDADNTPFLFEALLGGTVVDSFSANVGVSSNDFYGFSNDVFNAIRITQTGAGGGPYWVADNIQFGAAANAVPEPATLSLVGLGLIGLSVMIRRRTKAI